jgi:hypothetical protein
MAHQDIPLMFFQYLRRLRGAFYVASGRIILPSDLEGMLLMAELANTALALTALSAAADRVLAKAQADSAAAADAAATIAQVDESTAAQINSVTDKLNAYAPEAAPTLELTDPAPTEQPEA